MHSQHPSVRPIIQEYLRACEGILSDQPNATHAFILASQGLMIRDGEMTDDELRSVQDSLHRVAIKTMPASGQQSK